eukprot:8830524-Pyramimonas_sp.AAC.1
MRCLGRSVQQAHYASSVAIFRLYQHSPSTRSCTRTGLVWLLARATDPRLRCDLTQDRRLGCVPRRTHWNREALAQSLRSAQSRARFHMELEAYMCSRADEWHNIQRDEQAPDADCGFFMDARTTIDSKYFAVAHECRSGRRALAATVAPAFDQQRELRRKPGGFDL